MHYSSPSEGPGYFWGAKSNQNRSPEARPAQNGGFPARFTRYAASHAAYPYAGCESVAFHEQRPRGLSLLAPVLGSRYGDI